MGKQSDELRERREKTVINEISLEEEKQIKNVVKDLKEVLERKYKIKLIHELQLSVKAIIEKLKENYPDVTFGKVSNNRSHMRPDGGILYIIDKNKGKYPILISEVKSQGTNDKRKKEGKDEQAKGNAIERLGKNVIGLRAFMMNEDIFPFVCFGDGCDFKEGSSILDRVLTIALFGQLNELHTQNEKSGNNIFNRGSYYFREERWKGTEIYDILFHVAIQSIEYYFDKYGEKNFH